MSAVKWASKQAVPWKECEGVDTFKMGSMEESNRIQALCRQVVSQDSAKKADVMGVVTQTKWVLILTHALWDQSRAPETSYGFLVLLRGEDYNVKEQREGLLLREASPKEKERERLGMFLLCNLPVRVVSLEPEVSHGWTSPYMKGDTPHIAYLIFTLVH